MSTVQTVDATKQLAVVERITALVESAKEILGDESCLDVLDGPEAQNLEELQGSISNASTMLRALRKQLKARGAMRSG